jgi:hypothetical protein
VLRQSCLLQQELTRIFLNGACGSGVALRFQRTDNRNIAATARTLPFRTSSRLRNPERRG